MDLDPEDFESLGYGDAFTQLACSGWAERRIAAALESTRAYRATPQGKAARAQSNARYKAGEAAKAARARYLRTKGYETMRRYQATEAGRAARARANARYRAKQR